MSVLKKLNEARMTFHASDIKKSGWNDYSKYAYFELADFLIPSLKIFNELGISAVVSFATDIATMTLTDLEDGSQFLITSPMSTASLKACHEVQNLGAVQTYLRRYLWIAALEIVEHDAIDSSEPVKPAEKVRLPVLTDEEAAHEYTKWQAQKATLVDEEGDPDQPRQADAWGKLPSNVRTAIHKYGKSLQPQQETKQ